MTKYEIQAKFGKTWVTVETKDRHADALHDIRERVGENYPMRLVRVTRTVILEEIKGK